MPKGKIKPALANLKLGFKKVLKVEMSIFGVKRKFYNSKVGTFRLQREFFVNPPDFVNFDPIIRKKTSQKYSYLPFG